MLSLLIKKKSRERCTQDSSIIPIIDPTEWNAHLGASKNLQMYCNLHKYTMEITVGIRSFI